MKSALPESPGLVGRFQLLSVVFTDAGGQRQEAVLKIDTTTGETWCLWYSNHAVDGVGRENRHWEPIPKHVEWKVDQDGRPIPGTVEVKHGKGA